MNASFRVLCKPRLVFSRIIGPIMYVIGYYLSSLSLELSHLFVSNREVIFFLYPGRWPGSAPQVRLIWESPEPQPGVYARDQRVRRVSCTTSRPAAPKFAVNTGT